MNFRLFTALAAFQLFNKLLSFGLNQLLMQIFIHDKSMLTLLGRMNVQMEGYFNLVIFFSVEGLRQLALKRSVRTAYWLPFYIGLFISFITLPFQDTLTRFYLLAALLHLSVEGSYIELRSHNMFHRRILIDSGAVILRYILLLVQLYHHSPELTEASITWIIGRSQVASSFFFAMCYFLSFHNGLRPQSISFLPELVQQYKNLLLKGILNSLDVVLLMVHDVPMDALNAYSIAINQYGSLVPRLLFSPLEESCRVHFSKKPDLSSFKKLFRLEFYFTLLIALFGPFYHYIILEYIIERDHTLYKAISSLLSLYCLYLPFMSSLGILDAYLSAITKPSSAVVGLSRSQVALIWNVIVVLISGPVFLTQFPLYGLLLTQWISTLFRLIYVAFELRINPELPIQLLPLCTMVFISLDIIQGNLSIGILIGMLTAGSFYLMDPGRTAKVHKD